MFTGRSVFSRIFFVFFTSLLLLGAVSYSSAAEPAKPPAKVAILPFSMHTPSDLAYLRSGIRDMLASRIAWQGRVQVVDRSATEAAMRGGKGDISPADAARIGASLRADYVLYGSLTAVGQSISIDAKMAPVSGGGDPVSLYAQTKSMDDVIPQINQFAQQINQKVFARPEERTQMAAAEAEAASTRNPELLVPGSMIAGDKISYLNPNFIEVTPEGSLRQPGLWRSQTFNGGVLGMDVGDLDGDGREEIVTITFNKLSVYRREYQGLKLIASYDAQTVDRLVWVCIADLNRDGRGKIFVTNLRKQNKTRPAQTESTKGDAGFVQDISSIVFEMAGPKLQIVADKVPYFLNTAYLGKRGKVLVGQAKGQLSDGAFRGDVHEMALRGKSVVPTVSVNLPSRCNVFNFARADINDDKMEETIVVDASQHLLILNSAGEQIWKGGNIFCATTNTFEAKVEDRRYNLIDLFAIPAPILITDVNKDGIPEIVLNRNTTNLDRFLPDSMKYWDKGEIVSLSWDQLGLVENWKTREINGMVTSVRIGDLNGDGTKELIAGLVLAKDFLKLWDSRSTIFSYDLNVAAPKTAAKSQ